MEEQQELLIAHIGHSAAHCEHIAWWGPGGCGYTSCVDKAGRYSAERADEICKLGRCIAVDAAFVKSLAKSTPYFRCGDGSLARMYDGGELSPVPNSRQAWAILMKRRAYPSIRPRMSPTPMPPSKARSIYLAARMGGEWVPGDQGPSEPLSLCMLTVQFRDFEPFVPDTGYYRIGAQWCVPGGPSLPSTHLVLAWKPWPGPYRPEIVPAQEGGRP